MGKHGTAHPKRTPRCEEFQKETLKTITLNEKEGIKAIIGKPKGKHAMEI